jgi:hypothetical protein
VNDNAGNWTLPDPVETDYQGIDVQPNCDVEKLVKSFLDPSDAPRVVCGVAAVVMLVVAVL